MGNLDNENFRCEKKGLNLKNKQAIGSFSYYNLIVF